MSKEKAEKEMKALCSNIHDEEESEAIQQQIRQLMKDQEEEVMNNLKLREEPEEILYYPVVHLEESQWLEETEHSLNTFV